MASVLKMSKNQILLWAMLEKYSIVTHQMIQDKFAFKEYVIRRRKEPARVRDLIHELRAIIGYDKIVTVRGKGYYLQD